MTKQSLETEKSVSSLLAIARQIARKYGRIGISEPEDIAQQAVIKAL